MASGAAPVLAGDGKADDTRAPAMGNLAATDEAVFVVEGRKAPSRESWSLVSITVGMVGVPDSSSCSTKGCDAGAGMAAAAMAKEPVSDGVTSPLTSASVHAAMCCRSITERLSARVRSGRETRRKMNSSIQTVTDNKVKKNSTSK